MPGRRRRPIRRGRQRARRRSGRGRRWRRGLGLLRLGLLSLGPGILDLCRLGTGHRGLGHLRRHARGSPGRRIDGNGWARRPRASVDRCGWLAPARCRRAWGEAEPSGRAQLDRAVDGLRAQLVRLRPPGQPLGSRQEFELDQPLRLRLAEPGRQQGPELELVADLGIGHLDQAGRLAGDDPKPRRIRQTLKRHRRGWPGRGAEDDAPAITRALDLCSERAPQREAQRKAAGRIDRLARSEPVWCGRCERR